MSARIDQVASPAAAEKQVDSWVAAGADPASLAGLAE